MCRRFTSWSLNPGVSWIGAFTPHSTSRRPSGSSRFPVLSQHELVALHFESGRRILGDLAAEERTGQPRLEVALQEALERAGAEDRVVTLLGDPLLGLLVE